MCALEKSSNIFTEKKHCYLTERKGNYDHHSTVSRVHFVKIGVVQKKPELAMQMLKECTDT